MPEATQEQLLNAFKAAADSGDQVAAKAFATELQRMEQPAAAVAPVPAADPPLSFGDRFGQGLKDIRQGISQKVLQLTDLLPASTVTNAVSDAELGEAAKSEGLTLPEARAKLGQIAATGDAKPYTQGVNAKNAAYEARRGPGAGFDGGRLLGNIAGLAPLALVPGGQGVLARAGGGALAGGIAGIAQFDQTNSKGGAGKNVALGALGGAVLGPIAGVVGEKIGQAGRFVLGRIRGASAAAKPLEQEARQIVADAAPNATPQQAATLVDEAVAQVRATGNLNAEALARKANLVRNKVTPTKSMVTREAADWTKERNVQKLAGSPDETLSLTGRELTDIYTGNDRALSGRLDELGSGLPKKSTEELGDVAMKSLDDVATATQKDVSKLYTAVRETRGEELASDARHLAQTLDDLRDNTYAEKLVSSVTNKLKRFGMLDKEGNTTSKTLTVTQAEELRKFVNTLPNDYGRRDIIKAIDADVIGGLGDDAFGAARSAAAQRKELLDNPATQRALNTLGELQQGKTAQTFIKSQVINAADQDVDTLLATISNLEPAGAKQATDALRAGVFNELKAKAVNVNSGKFSGAVLNKELDRLGERKLIAIFGKEGTAELRSLARAALDATYEPPYSAVNHSNSGVTLLGMMRGARAAIGFNVPLVNEAAERSIERGVARSALRDTKAALPVSPRAQSATIDQLVAALRRGGPVAASPSANSRKKQAQAGR